MDIKNSKSIFAKLLAQENISVQHGKVPTASFDTKNRVLTLPIWKDMDGDLYDLLCGHEVGHALYTPAAGWHTAIMGSEDETDINKADMILKGYLNVLEDARIEKKIKAKYPGLRANFYRAYQGLHEKNFFEVNGKNLNDLMLIDRINLHFKLGSFVAVPFTGAEKSIVQRVERLETWAEVESLARELMALAKKELEAKKENIAKKIRVKVGPGEMSDIFDKEDGGTGDDEYEFDEDFEDMPGLTEAEKEVMRRKSVASETDRAFRNHEDDLLDPSSRAYEYVKVPTRKADEFILGYRSVMAQMVFEPDQVALAPATLAAFRKKNDKVVNYLIKEFELRRNAQQLSRAKISKSGEIDVKKIFSYRYNEDIFRRITSVPNGKNHGLVMFFDMSGSMSQQMGATIEQMLVLVEFCRKINIPFEVYGFSNAIGPTNPRQSQHYYGTFKANERDRELSIYDNAFYLRQYFSDRMRPTEYKQQFSNMTLMARIWHRRAHRWMRYNSDGQPMDPINMKIPESEELNGTPLNQTLMLSIDIYNKFVERTKAEVVNMVVLTDGDTDNNAHYTQMHERHGDIRGYQKSIDPHKNNVIFEHTETRKSVRVAETDKYCTAALVNLVREVTGCNMVCFDIVAGQGRRTIQHKMFRTDRVTPAQYNETEIAAKKFRKERVLVMQSQGYNEYYLIPGGAELDIDDDEIDVDAGADKKKIYKAFAEMQNNKTSSRILLNRFIKMIA